MTASKTQSASCDVGYGKPPRHTQFRKGQSGNPGGRPRGEPVERLKALTLQEAYRAVVIMEDGRAQPVSALQAILRSQIELAMKGNIRAQRDILTAVRTFERQDAEAAAMDACVEGLVQQAADLEEAIKAAKRAAPRVELEMSYVEAAQRIAARLGLNKSAESEIGAPGEEPVWEEEATEPDAAAPAPSPDGAQQQENDTASAAPPAASPPPSADPPAAPPADASAAPPVDARPWRSPRATGRANPKPSPGAGSLAGPLRNRRLPSRHSRRQKSGESLINSLFSGNSAAKASPRNNRITNCRAPRKRGTQ